MDPDECDRIIGISVNFSGDDGVGDGEVTDTEDNEDGVAIGSTPSAPVLPASANCPGVDGTSRGFGSASLAAVLDFIT